MIVCIIYRLNVCNRNKTYKKTWHETITLQKKVLGIAVADEWEYNMRYESNALVLNFDTH